MRYSALIFLALLFSLPVFLQAQRTYAPQSVLSQGNWYKMAVVESGVYRLDRTFFSSQGINADNLDPRNIRIYGNGGGMLPQANGDYRHDDLVENAIEVVGESDGSFDGNDYVLFYGESAHAWDFQINANKFQHEHNLYSDTNFYYLTIADAPGQRIEEVASMANETYVAQKSRGFTYHENEKENLIKSGRYWMGEKFDLITQRNLSFFMPDVAADGLIRLRIKVAARSDVASTFSFIVNGKEAGRLSLSSVAVNNNESIFYRSKTGEYLLSPSDVTGDSLKILISYNKGNSTRSEGWLDWIEVDYDQDFDLRNSNLSAFALGEGIGPGSIAKIEIANGSADYRIWDVTDPTKVEARAYSLNGTTLTYNTDASIPRYYLGFKGGYRTPAWVDPVSNQNLHKEENIEYLIIAYPGFSAAAEKLAGFHEVHYNRSTKVVYPEQIYNEFSSGRQDVTAIRDYIKMHYDRSGGTLPGFVCLLGDGSYDYKNITQSPQRVNFIPAYESRRSDSPTTSYTSDDFYGMLGENDGFWGEGTTSNDPYQRNLLDLAIGRLPVETAEDADLMVEKIITYATSPEAFGDWRSRVVLTADHKDSDGYTHVSQADAYTVPISDANPCINIEKIYLDNYPVLRTAGGTRFPEARDALMEEFDRGSLIVNYTGHGGEYAWSNSGILNLADIQSMANGVRQPAVVTATCEFGRFDDHDRRSGAEIFVTRPDGGAIALFTTVRLVYSSPNATLNRNFYKEVFTFDSVNQRMPTVGEIMMRTKNRTFPGGQTTDINSRNFTLLGDPGLILSYPQLNAVVAEINELPIDPTLQDSLASLALVKVKGSIIDDLGNAREDYSGDMNISVFDKPSKFLTRLEPFPFYWQTNRIFKGNASVEDGQFSFEFVVPIDVSYEEGSGKFSFYFSNEGEDGEGCYNNLYIGGTDENAAKDEQGPDVQVFINDEKWIEGGTTGPSPYLFAKVFDENGINTVASGIGHEIIGILDGDEQNVIILNEYYTAEKNNYQAGTVYYQMKDLEEGEHVLTVRVWDAANNPAEGSTSFLVASDARLALTRLLNYPNPFSTDQHSETTFLIGYNRSEATYDANVRIMSMDGRVVKVLNGTVETGSNYSCDITWDGRTEQGNLVSSGIYVYQVLLTDQATGETVKDGSKMVVLK